MPITPAYNQAGQPDLNRQPLCPSHTGLNLADDTVIEQKIITAERNAALRAAFGELAPRCRELLSMLITDPPPSYAEISATLQIPVGSIGPQRARCLERLRRTRSLSAFMGGEAMPARVRGSGGSERLDHPVTTLTAITFACGTLAPGR